MLKATQEINPGEPSTEKESRINTLILQERDSECTLWVLSQPKEALSDIMFFCLFRPYDINLFFQYINLEPCNNIWVSQTTP